MSEPTRHLRTRLLVAMVAVAFGVLVVAALGAAGIAKETSADSARHDLKKQAPTVAEELERLGPLFRRAFVANRNPEAITRACRFLAATLRISGGGLVSINADGSVEDGLQGLLGAACSDEGLSSLPPGVSIDDLDIDKLRGGVTTTAVHGGTAFVAQPLSNIGAVQPILVLTQDVETRPLGRAGPYLLATGAIALFLATIVSFWLARRLTRPIAAVQSTAGRLAAGDLTARVGQVSGPNDELASLAHSVDLMADELESARGQERAFLLNVSHDLRTPLTSIQGYAEAIADGTADSAEERARAAKVIATESRRLERLVADLLDLARLDARQFSLRPEPLDARAVVGAAVEGFAPAAAEYGVRLRLQPGEPVPATLDPERLGQIVANLVENALKYAESVVAVGVLGVGLADGTTMVELRVDDDGPGIAAEERARVFDRLYTTRDTPGRKVGTGLGLAIVHDLAVAMGGTATCEPLDPAGSRFVVTIPT